MSKHVKYVPKHRDVRDPSALTKGARSTLVYSGVAAIATGVSVSSGVLATGGGVPAAASVKDAVNVAHDGAAAAQVSDRSTQVSRSAGDRRVQAAAVKKAALDDAGGVARTQTQKINPSDVKSLARALMPEYGLKTAEFGCLDRIWNQESKWNVHADNPSSSAYGIPQALPGSKMSSAGPDWADNAETQIRWGLGYVRDRYGSACSAWGFKAAHGWY